VLFAEWWFLLQGFLLTSTQQMVDRLVLQTQDSITALSQVPVEDVQLIEETKGLIADAENVKQVLDNSFIFSNGMIFICYQQKFGLTFTPKGNRNLIRSLDIQIYFTS
jgi:hypothetical protein